MARISSYPYDFTITDTDAWVGSDSVTRATKQCNYDKCRYDAIIYNRQHRSECCRFYELLRR